MCVYVCVCVCVCVCMCVCVCVCVCVCTLTASWYYFSGLVRPITENATLNWTFAQKHTHARAHTHTHTVAHIHTHARAHARSYIHPTENNTQKQKHLSAYLITYVLKTYLVAWFDNRMSLFHHRWNNQKGETFNTQKCFCHTNNNSDDDHNNTNHHQQQQHHHYHHHTFLKHSFPVL